MNTEYMTDADSPHSGKKDVYIIIGQKYLSYLEIFIQIMFYSRDEE